MSATVNTWEPLRYQWLVWRFYGMAPPSRESVWRKPYIISTIFLHLTTSLLFPTTLVINCCLSKSISEFCEYFTVAITDVLCNLKFLNAYISRRHLKSVRGILEQLDKRAIAEEEKQILQDGKNAAKNCFMFRLRMILIICISSNLMVYVTNERRLMFASWFPWNWKESRKYFIISYLYQLYALTAQSSMEFTNDTYPLLHMCILSAHIKALGVRIKNIGRKIEREQNFTNESLAYEQQEEQFYKELIGCIKDYKTITKLFNIIQKTLSVTCVVQFLGTILGQCTLAVYLLFNDYMDIVQLLHNVLIFTLVSLLTYDLCNFGDSLHQEYVNLGDAIYACNWIDRNKKFKMALLLILNRSQKFNILTGHKIVPLNLPTFLKGRKKIS